MALLFFLSAVVPLIGMGVFATYWSYRTSLNNIVQRNQRLSNAAAEQIDLYVKQEMNLINALAQNIERTGLQKWQKEAILKNYVGRFPSLLSIVLVDKHGKLTATSEMEGDGRTDFTDKQAFIEAMQKKQSYFSPLILNDELLPTLEVSVPVRVRGAIEGALISTLNIVDLWKIVDGIRVGNAGYCVLLDPDGKLVAHGDPRGKALTLEKWDALNKQPGVNAWGERVLQASANVPSPGWRLMIEQPESEALGGARRIVLYGGLVALFVLSASLVVGIAGGKHIVSAVERLMEGTRRLASGELDYKVTLSGKDELARLAEAFNRMGDDLLRLQREVALRERMSTFGRVAAALAHDLKHPINNLRFNSGMLEEKYADPTYRRHFLDVIERELGSLNYIVTQLRDMAQKRDLVKIPLDFCHEVRQVAASMHEELHSRQVKLALAEPDLPIYILGDTQAIRRLISNIIRNAFDAIESTQPRPANPEIGIEVADDTVTSEAVLCFKDNGCGIAPERLPHIFEEFRTTKNDGKQSGLGLGMPIIRQICTEHGGSVEVSSQVGVGTQILIRLPLAKGAVARLNTIDA